ncbi:MAG TPA: hypothetical protein VI564_00740 [Candidatus Nanoarchaeia archaeon]|nr:hypothetical protein [Candidatus Nanoarchaeia archaeon]
MNLLIYVLALTFSCAVYISLIPFAQDSVIGLNVSNQTVLARVNVSNTEPSLYDVRITYPSIPIDLTANADTTIICNGSVYDTNGFDDIMNVTATFYYNETPSIASDDGNNHYSNISCGNCSVIPGSGNQNGSCLCQFAVRYYANPGLWQCNMTVNDSGGLTSTFNSSFVRVNEVIGINVENTTLDYGALSVSQTSNPIRENVTNTGNIPINFTVRGYGGDDESIGQNVSMICEAGTNITFGYQRYSLLSSTTYADMYNLTNQSRQVINITIPQRTSEGGFGNSSNSTFWRLQVPIGAAGICNGTIIFGAIDALNR